MGTTRLAIGLIALTVLGFVHADDGFFGSGVETVYRYFADVRAESQVPEEYASQFGIKADLHVQSIDGSKVFFQFQDVSYQVSTGPLDTHEYSEAKFVKSPPESDALKQPFEVIYEGGMVKSVMTMDEPLWSKNIKKAVAALFQLDMPHLHYDKPNNFWSEEKSLFGKCTIGYTVIPKGPGYFDIMKMQEYKRCEKFPTRYFTNGEYEKCKYDHQEDSLLMGGTRYYKLSTEGGLKIKEIYAKSVAAAVPFNGASDDQSVLVRQNFTFVSAKPISEAINFTPVKEYEDLTYVIPSYYNEDGTMSDLSGGRVHFDKEVIMEKMHKSLEKLVHYMDEMKVVADPEKLNSQVIEPVTYYIGKLDAECLSHCFERYSKPKTTYEENLRGAFLEVTAQVGSKASVLFIRDLIVSHKIPDSLASEILRLVPLYVREPSTALAKEYEAILNVDMDSRVKKSAVLSVANMVSLTYKKVHDIETFNHFADMFFESFKTATKYGEKLNYLTAIVNLGDGKAFEYLMQVVEDHHISNHLRYVALWGTYDGGMKNPTKVYNLYWPIFINHEEPVEMRAAAMKLLLMTDESFDRFLSIFWYMQSEPSSQLYYYFYTGLESIHTTQHPCYKTAGHHAERFIRYAKPPTTEYLFTGDYYMDYMDPEHSIGGGSQFSWIGDAHTGAPSVFYYSMDGYFSGCSNEYFAVQIRLTGVAESVETQLLKVDREAIKMGDLTKILESLHIKPTHLEPFHVEIIFYTNLRIVETFYYDESNFMKLVDDIKGIGSSLQRDFKLRHHNVLYSTIHEYVQPTDMGLPAVWNMAVPYIQTLEGNFTHDTTGPRIARKNSMEYRYGRTGGHSLSFYNPFGGLWQGAHRTFVHMYTVPMHNHMSIDFAQKHFKFAMTRDEKEDLHLGLVYHVRTQVFATDHTSDDTLHGSCPTCSRFVTVHKAGREDRSFNVISHDCPQTGMTYKFDVFDCDQYEKPYELVALVEKMFETDHINADSGDIFGEFFMQVRRMHTFLGLSPKVGSCGMVFQVVPSTEYKVNQVEGVVQMTSEESKEGHDLSVFPGGKYTVRGTVTLKDDEKVYHTFDVNTFLEQSAGHVSQHFGFKVTHSAPKQKDYKICMDWESKYPEWPADHFAVRKAHDEEMTSKITMSWGESVDGKCPTDGSGFKAKFTATPAENDHEHGLAYPYSECAKDSESPVWKGKPYKPVTDACFHSALYSTLLRKFTGYAKYYNIPDEFFEMASTVYESLEDVIDVHEISGEGHHLTVEVSPTSEKHPGSGKTGVLKYDIEFDEDKPHVEFHFGWEGEEEEEHYLVDFEEDMAMWSSRFFFWRRLGYEMGFLSSCVVTPSTVLTLDNDTFHYHSSHCYTLSSADCSDHPKYAVFTKKVEGPYDVAVKFYAGGNYLEIVPDVDGHFHVKVNGEEVAGGLKNGYQYPEGEQFYDFKLWHKDGFVTLFSQLSRVMVEYTGHSVSVTVPAMYRGHSCGVCGNFNSDATFSERQEVSSSCPHGEEVGNYLGYRYTMVGEKCPEITEEMTKHVQCGEHH
ncbi:vitellogenin-1-like [Ischnura elegans]|uniref:vitellogenin-1-like n=1 Tax=Ischnura elegans TaxID=197161 RepID=UPI001ED8A0B2|nr:vitellogenin-1-like [Ischnura elegans]